MISRSPCYQVSAESRGVIKNESRSKLRPIVVVGTTKGGADDCDDTFGRVHCKRCPVVRGVRVGEYQRGRLASRPPQAQRLRVRTIAAGDLRALEQEWLSVNPRFGLMLTAVVRSCYEAETGWLLAASMTTDAGRGQCRGRFLEHGSESQGATGEERSRNPVALC